MKAKAGPSLLSKKTKWIDVLDYDPANKIVVEVTKWLCLGPVERSYFHYPFSLKILWNYRSIGVKEVSKKVLSRMKNHDLSQRYLSIGEGRVYRSNSPEFLEGESVCFIAPNHPEGLTRVALYPRFLEKKDFDICDDGVRWSSLGKGEHLFKELRGFDPLSGFAIPEISFSHIKKTLKSIDWNEVEKISEASFFEPSRSEKEGFSIQKKHMGKSNSITIFGWGHHARTQIHPNIPAPYYLRCVHDLSPLVLTMAPKSAAISTQKDLSLNDSSSVLIVASYHHMHADVVIQALESGKNVICEKPLATTWEQYFRLEKVLQTHPRLLMAYHRRYDAFFSNLGRDLKLKTHPIRYFCEVRQVRLPNLHWYNWPLSGSKILSNGCHWIDHFLALKPDEKICSWKAEEGESDIRCELTLEDGSTFIMHLSDKGSDAKGNREEIVIRCSENEVKIENFELYTATSPSYRRVEATKKLDVFPRMYATIFKNISEHKYDNVSSLLRTQFALLKLEDCLKSR